MQRLAQLIREQAALTRVQCLAFQMTSELTDYSDLSDIYQQMGEAMSLKAEEEDDKLYRLPRENAPQTLVDGSPLMLMTHFRPDQATRPMQERGKRLFKTRRESYRDNQKNAADRLLHAFPAMIVAR